jgi:hypothetical protein
MNDRTTDAVHAEIEGLLAGHAAGTLAQAQADLVRRHVAGCSVCRSALAEWEEVGAATRLLAGETPAPARGTLDRVLDRIERGALEPTPLRRARWYERLAGGRLARPLGTGLAAAALAAAVLLTPVGSYAQGVLARFQPQQFVAVPVSVDDLASLPSLRQFGDFQSDPAGQPHPVASASEAAAATGMTLLTPGWLPADAPKPVSYVVVPGHGARFTFVAAKARETAARQGKTMPPMPANIDGSSLQVSVGSAAAAIYGDPAALQALEGRAGAGRDQARPTIAPAAPKAGASAPQAGAAGTGLPDVGRYPRLVIGQAPAPTVTATGAPVPDLERYVLSLPGVSPELANAIKAIGDPTRTWPIPLPVQRVSSHPVQVHGATGLAIGDSTGLGSGVVWVSNGVVYVVAGTYKEREILTIADSLH